MPFRSLLKHLQRPRAAESELVKKFQPLSFCNDDGQTLKYRLFTPPGCERTPTLALPSALDRPPPPEHAPSFPLVVCLHGAGGAGSDNLKQLSGGSGIPASALVAEENQSRHPALVLAPQCPRGQTWLSLSEQPSPVAWLLLLALLDLQRRFSIDRHRIYLIGLSMGGHGVWDLASRFPAYFAAAVPMCAAADPSRAASLASLPIWCFHGAADPTVSVEHSRRMMEALRQAGGQPKYTEFARVGHDCARYAFKNPDLLPWLFGQTRRRLC